MDALPLTSPGPGQDSRLAPVDTRRQRFDALVATLAKIVSQPQTDHLCSDLMPHLEALAMLLGATRGGLFEIEEGTQAKRLLWQWPDGDPQSLLSEVAPLLQSEEGNDLQAPMAGRPTAGWVVQRLVAGPQTVGLLVFWLNDHSCLAADQSSLTVVTHLLAGALEHRRFEMYRAQSQERLNGILASLDDAVWAVDPATNTLLFVNPVAERILGRSMVELLADPWLWFAVAHPEDRDLVAGWQAALEEAGEADYQYRILRPDGAVRWLHVRLWRACSVSGAPDRIDGIASDVTERVEAARALQEARRREVAIAGQIQQMLLIGQPPEALAGAQVASLTIPSGGVDGDFYDFIRHDATCFDLIVGDVMGKGIPAALIGAAAKSAFLHALAQLGRTGGQVTPPASDHPSGFPPLPSPAALTNLAHRFLTRQLLALQRFLTLCFARFDLASRRLTLVDAGHTKTLLWRAAKDEVCFLEGGNCPLGFDTDEVYSEIECPLGDGDILVFSSDGLTEAANSDGEMFEASRLARLVQASSSLSPEALLRAIHQAVVDFTGSATFEDDLTLIVVRIGSLSSC